MGTRISKGNPLAPHRVTSDNPGRSRYNPCFADEIAPDDHPPPRAR